MAQDRSTRGESLELGRGVPFASLSVQFLGDLSVIFESSAPHVDQAAHQIANGIVSDAKVAHHAKLRPLGGSAT